MAINSVTISGNVVRDGELKDTNGGGKVLNFTIAVNERYRNKDGEYENRANFINCVLFNARAEGLAKYIKKGLKCAVTGRLRQSTWEADGVKRSSIEVIVNDFEFMQSKSSASDNYEPANDDEDVPF